MIAGISGTLKTCQLNDILLWNIIISYSFSSTITLESIISFEIYWLIAACRV